MRYGFHPAYAIYEPGFTRAGAALARALGAKTPIYRLMFSETFAYGFPPKPYALAAHLALLDEEAPGAPWMIAGLGVDIRPLIAETVRRGGHVRVGLEDAPFGTTDEQCRVGRGGRAPHPRRRRRAGDGRRDAAALARVA